MRWPRFRRLAKTRVVSCDAPALSSVRPGYQTMRTISLPAPFSIESLSRKCLSWVKRYRNALSELCPLSPPKAAELRTSGHVSEVPAVEVVILRSVELIVQPDAHDVDSKLQSSRGDKREAARSTWSLAERASRLVRMATGRSSSRRHIARGDPGRLLGDALELAKCPGADRLYLRDRSACGRRHSDRNRV